MKAFRASISLLSCNECAECAIVLVFFSKNAVSSSKDNSIAERNIFAHVKNYYLFLLKHLLLCLKLFIINYIQLLLERTSHEKHKRNELLGI